MNSLSEIMVSENKIKMIPMTQGHLTAGIAFIPKAAPKETQETNRQNKTIRASVLSSIDGYKAK